MAIKTFSDEEKAAIKNEAATRFPGGRALVINLDDPINETVVFAPFDRASYATHWEAGLKDKQSACGSVWAERRVWPGLVEAEAVRQAWAAAPEQVANELEREARGLGKEGGSVLLSLDALPPGLDPGEARGLVADAKGARLWLVTEPQTPTFQVVMQTPDVQTWIAARAAHDDAARRGRGIIDAIDPFVLATNVIRWSAVPLVPLLDAHPALIFELWGAYKRAGGDGAKARTFLL